MSSSSPSPPRSPLIHLLLLLALFPGFLVVLADRGWPRPLRGVSPEGYEVINVSTTAGDAVPNCGGDGDAVCVPDVCDNAQAMLHGRLAPGSTQVTHDHARERTYRKDASPDSPLAPSFLWVNFFLPPSCRRSPRRTKKKGEKLVLFLTSYTPNSAI